MWVLLEIDVYEQELAFDFRQKFHISIEEVGKTISIKEAYNLISGLHKDLTSHYASKVNKMKLPLSFEYLAMADVYDAVTELNFTLMQVNSRKKLQRKHKPHWRPFENKNNKNKLLDLPVQKLTLAQAAEKYGKYNPKD